MLLTVRNRQSEIMDGPELAAPSHGQALRGLERLNWISGTAAALWACLHKRMRASSQPLRILDVACGGGDVTRALARKAARVGIRVTIHGCDRSPFAVEWCRERALHELDYFSLDVAQVPLPTDYDVVMCSLFLHHLQDHEVVELLAAMAAATKQLVLADDLRRSILGYTLAAAGCQLLSRSPVVHTDALRSVAAAFTSREIVQLAHRAGLNDCSLSFHWPQRFLLQWTKA